MSGSDFKVVIVGAGPAGAICAYELSRLDFPVLLLEKENLPRFKPCGGALPVKAEKLIDFELEKVIRKKVSRVDIIYDNQEVNYSSQTPFLNLVNRNQFDEYLVKSGCEQGLSFHEGEEVKSIQKKGSSLIVKTDQDKYTSSIIVGADGILSTVAKSYGFDHNLERSITFSADLDISNGSRFNKNLLLDLEILSSGYGWIFPKKDRVSVGIGEIFKSDFNLKELFNNMLEKYKISQLDFINEPRGYLIPQGGSQLELVKDNILLTGDAAGLADPLTGEGIYYALKSGVEAAAAIKNYFRGKNSLNIYQDIINEEIISELKISSRLAFVFYKFMPFIFNLMKKDEDLMNTLVEVVAGNIKYKDVYKILNRKFLLSKNKRINKLLNF